MVLEDLEKNSSPNRNWTNYIIRAVKQMFMLSIVSLMGLNLMNFTR